jgi:UDP-N-acetylglucosamine transferase subunit ALG13
LIFVCTGTQVYQFNRLLSKLDDLIEDGTISDKVFSQTGASTYIPKNYGYKAFLSHDEFERYQEEATLIISHGGTGALIGASKKGKNIIAVPRLAKYGEHVDDHQLQIVDVLAKEGYVRVAYEMSDLEKIIQVAIANPIIKRYNRESCIIDVIRDYISRHI